MLWIELNIIKFVNVKTAKEVWRILKITHEGTNQIKDSKVRILVNDYETFKMKPNESIVEMFTRFIDVVNGLEGLENKVSEEDNISKILRCLPPKWNSKMEAIEEANNLKELPLEELIGSLMTYEMKIARQEKEKEEKEGKKKNIALKAQEEKVVEEAKINDMEHYISFNTKRVQKLMMKDKLSGKTYNKRSNYKREGPSREEKEKREGASEVICYKCKKLGHIKYDCPLYKAKREKIRAMMTTWSHSEDSSEDQNDEEIANMCFMAFEDQDEVNSNLMMMNLLLNMRNCLKTSTSLMKRIPHLRRKLLSFKNNFMESKKNFQKLKLQKFLIRR